MLEKTVNHFTLSSPLSLLTLSQLLPLSLSQLLSHNPASHSPMAHHPPSRGSSLPLHLSTLSLTRPHTTLSSPWPLSHNPSPSPISHNSSCTDTHPLIDTTHHHQRYQASSLSLLCTNTLFYSL